MTFDGETIYTELRPHLQRRVLRSEPLARHSTFGVGGPADIWVSLETSRELVDLVSLCSERQCPCCWLATAPTYFLLTQVCAVLLLVSPSTVTALKIEEMVQRCCGRRQARAGRVS